MITGTSQTLPGFVTPGQWTISGTRDAALVAEPLPTRSGAFDVVGTRPPLSDVKMMIVRSRQLQLVELARDTARPSSSRLSIIAA